jgi:hypothetical protein
MRLTLPVFNSLADFPQNLKPAFSHFPPRLSLFRAEFGGPALLPGVLRTTPFGVKRAAGISACGPIIFALLDFENPALGRFD